MSTTPRTDAIEERNGSVLCGSANLGFARTLERELAEVKANFKEERRFLIAEIKELNAELRREAALVSKIDQLETELAQLRAELVKIYSLVAPHGCDLAPNGIYETARVVSDLLDQLRAENERLKDHAFDKDGTPWKTVCGWWAKKYDAAERQMRENAARAERAEAEVERLNKAIKVDTPKMVKLNNEILTENGRLLARAEKAEAKLAAEREKVRVLREALQNGVTFPITTVNWYEQACAALDATKEAGQ